MQKNYLPFLSLGLSPMCLYLSPNTFCLTFKRLSIFVRRPLAYRQRPNSWAKSRQNSSEFSCLLFTVTSTALPWDFYFFKLTQPIMYSFKLTQPLMCFYSSVTVHCKGERRKTWKKTIPLFLRFKKYIQKHQVRQLSRLCPETSAKVGF
jgi:hypothetical protein